MLPGNLDRGEKTWTSPIIWEFGISAMSGWLLASPADLKTVASIPTIRWVVVAFLSGTGIKSDYVTDLI